MREKEKNQVVENFNVIRRILPRQVELLNESVSKVLAEMETDNEEAYFNLILGFYDYLKALYQVAMAERTILGKPQSKEQIEDCRIMEKKQDGLRQLKAYYEQTGHLDEDALGELLNEKQSATIH